jgi:hypothetical protein
MVLLTIAGDAWRAIRAAPAANIAASPAGVAGLTPFVEPPSSGKPLIHNCFY